MKNILKALDNDFVIIDLGSSVAENNPFLYNFFSAITSIEIDALRSSHTTSDLFYKSIKLKSGINVTSERAIFYERQYFQCSSFLKIREGIPEMYGIEEQTKIINEIPLDCVTLPELLVKEKVKRVDFLKTDLEGIDASILKSAELYLIDALVVQSELRFQPFYETEPYYFETCAYLQRLGYDIISITTEKWKYNTRNRSKFRDGRLVWGDFIFFKTLLPDNPDFAKNILKQILLAKSLKLNSHAEYLFEKSKDHFAKEVQDELSQLLKPKLSIGQAITNFFSLISNLPYYSVVRKSLRGLYVKSSVANQHFPWWTNN